MRHELAAYGHGLAEKQEIVALTKIDAIDAKAAKAVQTKLRKAAGVRPLLMSAVSGEGVEAALRAIAQIAAEAKARARRRHPRRKGRGLAVVTRKPEDFRRIVIKIGSSLLVDRETGRLRSAWLEALTNDIAQLARGGRELLVVSSGAIALGRGVLGLPRGVLKLEESQAAAAVGQIALAHAYTDMLHKVGLTAGQVLLTFGDTEERRRYLNARSTVGTLLKLRAVPVINENDTVATSEIRYGDNDRLAARVATMMSADLLVLLSDVAGLYTAPPAHDPNATLIETVERITPEIEAMAGAAASELSRGGMETKIAAGKIATQAGDDDGDRVGHRAPAPCRASPPARSAPGSCPTPTP